MKKLDRQFIQWKNLLIQEVKISEENCTQLASKIEKEIRAFDDGKRAKLIKATPISFETRIEELSAFQNMMETYNNMRPRPEIVRSQVITQNYICFVYLKDSLFETLKKISESGSVTRKCCTFLLNNPVRAFRNSIAHGNWKYRNDFSGLDFWSYKGEPDDNPMDKWTVSQVELGFWQALSRTVAYVSYLSIREK